MLCGGGGGGDTEAKTRNRQIELEIRKNKKDNAKSCKMLLLGTGDSGKSTMSKQMKIIHLAGFTEEECQIYRTAIFNNIIEYMQLILRTGLDHCSCTLPSHLQEKADMILACPEPSMHKPIDFTTELREAVATLLDEECVHIAVRQGARFHLHDSAAYFFSEFDRIAEPDYQPSTLDMLRVRVKTTGIVEIEWTIAGTRFRLIDVGGQRNERKKWIHCFDNVMAVLFCAAMSEYDQQLAENPSVNRMSESLSLFGELINNMWFENINIILFLNKMDLFREKIKEVDLACCFPNYSGGHDIDAAKEYIKDKFLSLNENQERQVYSHFTCATDTENVKLIFKAVRDIMLKEVIDTITI